MQEQQIKPHGYWHIAGLLSLGYAVSFLDRALVGVAGSPIKHDLGLSDSQFGALHGMAFVTLYCLCGVPLGWLADRVDRRRMIATGLVFWSVMTALCGLATSYSGFFAARIGVGLGEACLLPAGMSLLGSVMPPRKMAQAVALFLMGATAGNALALLGGGQILNLLDAWTVSLPFVGVLPPWRLLFLLAAIPGLITALLFLRLRGPDRTATLNGSSLSDSFGEFRAALTHLRANAKAYTLLTAATACSVTLAQAQSAWLPQLYVRRFGLSTGDSALIIGFMFLISAPIGQWFGGRLIDRLRARGVHHAPHLVLAGCAILCIFPAVIFCTAQQLWISESAYTLFNFLVFCATPAGLTGWQCLTPQRFRGVLIALLVSVVTLIGVGFGPYLVGLLTDHVFHDEQALGLALLIIILSAGIMGSVFALTGRRSFAQTVLPLSSHQAGAADQPTA